MERKAYINEYYTAQEFLDDFIANRPESERYELIDGYVYMMSSPTPTHQRIVNYINVVFYNYLQGKECDVFIAPLDVFLFNKKQFSLFDIKTKIICDNVFQPDLFVVCDKDKITNKGCEGAPDLVVEVVSKSTSNNDYVYKFNNYMRFGVKEYWIVNPMTRQMNVYVNRGAEFEAHNYTFDDIVKVSVFDDLSVDFSECKEF